MWLSSEVDAASGLLSPYECPGLEDSASAFHPTFMRERLEWLPDDYVLPRGSYDCDVPGMHFTEHEYLTQGTTHSNSSTYYRQVGQENKSVTRVWV